MVTMTTMVCAVDGKFAGHADGFYDAKLRRLTRRRWGDNCPVDGDGDDDDDAVLKISLTSNSNVLLAVWVTSFIPVQHVARSMLMLFGIL